MSCRSWRAWAGAALFVSLLSGAVAQTASGPQPDAPAREIQVAAEAFVRADPIPDWVEPVEAPATQRKTPQVIRLWDTQIRLTPQGSSSVFVNRAVQVNDSSALARVGQLSVDFVPQYQRLHLHRVRIIRGKEVLDQTQAIQVRFLQREEGLENGVYSGAVTASMLVRDLRVGDTLQVSYVVDGLNPVFGKAYVDTAGWDADAPIEWRRLLVSHPDSREVQWRLIDNGSATPVAPKVTASKGWRSMLFEVRGNEAVEFEPQIPRNVFPFRYIQFSEFRDWRAVAVWADALFPPVTALPEELQALRTRLKALPTKEAQAMGALQWVQREIRYFSVSMGESSHRPHTPAEVVQSRFGDCKDKTYLLLTLLRSLGMEAYPVLLSAQAPKTPAGMLPSPLAFDHAITQLKLNGRTHYLDATRAGQTGALTQMGLIAEGAQALVATPGTTGLTVMHWPNALDLNTMEWTDALSMKQLGGEGALVTTRTWLGGNAESVRMSVQRLTQEQWRKYILGTYERRYPGISLEGEPAFQDDTERNRITMTARMRIPKLAIEVDGNWAVKYLPGNLVGVFSVPDNLTRRFPAEALDFPYRARYHLTLDWPDSVAVTQDPYNRHLHNEAFDLDVQQRFRGQHATLDLVLETLTDVVQPKDLSKLSEDVRRLSDAIGSAIYVARGSIKGAEPVAAGTTPLQQSLQRRFKDTVTRLSKTIEGGKLQGEDLAEALCGRAEAYADLGQPADGIKDAEQAVRVAPAFGRAWECRGNVYSDNAQFDKSIPDFTRALTLGSEGSVLLRRGLSRYYLGKYAEAAADFARMAKPAAGSDASVDLYATLWRVLALKRLGKPVPADVASLAQQAPLGEWPRPALALMAGQLDPDQVLAQVNRLKGDEREMNLTEAWFFIGQYHLLQAHNNVAAKAAFEKTRAQGVTMYLEHMAAGWELDRLKAR